MDASAGNGGDPSTVLLGVGWRCPLRIELGDMRWTDSNTAGLNGPLFSSLDGGLTLGREGNNEGQEER